MSNSKNTKAVLTEKPALLVSYFYWPSFQPHQHRIDCRFYTLDSGAYSVHNSGETVSLERYTRFCQMQQALDSRLKEIYALDVVSDPVASLRNCERMWQQGVSAIPCFHYGEDWALLTHLAANYPKIALGGAVGKGDRIEWAKRCFDKVYPKPIHGFGFGARKAVFALPWHSVDAVSWNLGTLAFGRSRKFTGMRMASQVGRKVDLSAEMLTFLKLEQEAKHYWRNETEFSYYLGWSSNVPSMLNTTLLNKDTSDEPAS